MKKFEFRLSALQKAKTTQEKEIRKELSMIERRLEEQQRQLLDIEDAKADLKRQWQADMAGGTGAASVRQFGISFDCLSEQRDQIFVEIDKIEIEKSDCLRRLTLLQTDLKGLETLHDKQLEIHQKEIARESEQEISDFVSYRQKAAGTVI